MNLNEETTLDVDKWNQMDSKQPENKRIEPQPVVEGNVVLKPSVCAPKPANQLERLNLDDVVKRIEEKKVDIAPSYDEWIKMGFALANAMGEEGRSYFHRISFFHSDYNREATDKQYNSCLSSSNHSNTLGTFFFIAKNHGVGIIEEEETAPIFSNMPTLPDDIIHALPTLFKEATQFALSPKERDLMLLGSLVCVSSCLNHFSGIINGDRLFSNLYLYCVAPAASGKSRLKYCPEIVMKIHNEIVEKSLQDIRDYEVKKALYDASRDKDPADCPRKPPFRQLLIPANNSASKFFKSLNDNNGVGMIYEPESDTLSDALGKEHGDFSDGMRSAYQHERIALSRCKDDEFFEIINPKLSILLAGTPQQVSRLIPDVENGLFSRFAFYTMPRSEKYESGFQLKVVLKEKFEEMGSRFYDFHKIFTALGDIEFVLTEQQEKRLDAFIEEKFLYYRKQYGDATSASIFRMRICFFRIAMNLTATRIMDTGAFAHKIVCGDDDFEISYYITNELMSHMAAVYCAFYKRNVDRFEKETLIMMKPQDRLLDMLPAQFSAEECIQIAEQLIISRRTAFRYLEKFKKSGTIVLNNHGNYTKV